MFPNRLLALTLFAALAVMPPCVLRAQWVPTNGPYGGDISCFAAKGTNLFAGTYDAPGVFRSTDSGLTWKCASSNFSGVTAIGTIGTNVVAGSNDGVFYSTDSGSTWDVSSNFPGGGGFASITGIVAIGKDLFAAVNEEDTWCITYLSRDSGKTWIDTGAPPGVVESLIVSGGKIFAGTDGGVFLTNDTGETWTKVSTGLSEPYVQSLAAIDSTLFAVAGNDSWTFFQAYVSTNDGSSWTPTKDSLPRGMPFRIAVGNNINSVHTLLVGGDSGVFLSTNNGDTWIDAGIANYDIQSIAVFGTVLLVGTLDGLYRSTDKGNSWNLVGLPCTNVFSLASQGSNLVAGTSYVGHVYVSTNDGNSWSLTSYDSENNGNAVDALLSYGSIIFLSSASDGVQCSRDTGKTWEDPGNRWTNGLGNTSFDCSVTDGKIIIAGSGDDEIFLSTDTGITWVLSDSTLTNDNINSAVLALVINGTTILGGTSNIGILRSTDAGTTWAVANNGLTDTTVLSLAVSGSTIFAGTYPNGVFLSTDDGSNWTPSNIGLKNSTVYDFAVNGLNIFAATDSGVFLSNNNGTSWLSVNNDLSASRIHALAITDSFLFAATVSAGVWRRPLSDFGISSVAQTPATTPSKIHIFPNPFSQSTQITFTSQTAGYAEVTIVNMLGVEVARMFSGELGDGNHSFSWSNPTGLPDGMYECLVRMNGQVQTLPLVLVR